MFTKITIGVASFWLVLAVATVMVHKGADSVYGGRKAQTPDITVEDLPLGGLSPDNLLLQDPIVPDADLAPLTDDSSLPTEDEAASDTQTQSESEQTTKPDSDS